MQKFLSFFNFPKKDSEKPKMRRSTLILFLLVLGVYFSFGLSHLGKFQTADEDLWYMDPVMGRIHNYWKAMESGDWIRTRINDKPGVTTAILGYWGYKMDINPEQKMISNGSIVDHYNPELYEKTAFYYQLPFVLANGLLLLLLFWLAWKYTENDLFTLLFAGFTALTPLLVGISQIVNPDATVWSFGITTLFAFLLFLKTTHFKWLLLASPLFGLALLSKYGTAFLIFFTFFLLFAHLFFHIETFSDAKHFAKTALKFVFGWIMFLLGSLLVFALLMPAALVHPEYLYQGTVGFRKTQDVAVILWNMGTLFFLFILDTALLRGKFLYPFFTKLRNLQQPALIVFSTLFLLFALVTLGNWGLGNIFNFKDVSYDTGTGIAFTRLDFIWKPFLEIKPLVFTMQPALLFLALFTLLFLIWRPHRFTFLLFTFVTYLVFFYSAILFQDILVHGRYSVLLYPVLAGIASIGVLFFLDRYGKTFFQKFVFIILLFALSGFSLFSSAPYYFNYTNNLLPKDKIVTGAWGYGGYEAVQYLNTLPDAKNLTIWADYEGVCPFFDGKCIKGSVIKSYNRKQLSGFDYAVVSRRGLIQNKSTWKKLKEEEKFYPDPVWKLHIGGREKNFVEVYKMKEEFNSSTIR